MSGFFERSYLGGTSGRRLPPARSSLYNGVTPEQVGQTDYARDTAQRSNTDALSGFQNLLQTWRSSGLYGDSAQAEPGWSYGQGWGGGSSSFASVAPIAPVDTSAAQAAAFARAKDRVGQMGAGAVAGLRASLGGRGLLGSGAEVRGTADVINRGQGELGDVLRGQAVEEADLAQRTAEANQRAAIAQRSQDLEDQMSQRDLSFRGYQAAQDRRQASRRDSLDALIRLWSQMRY